MVSRRSVAGGRLGRRVARERHVRGTGAAIAGGTGVARVAGAAARAGGPPSTERPAGANAQAGIVDPSSADLPGTACRPEHRGQSRQGETTRRGLVRGGTHLAEYEPGRLRNGPPIGWKRSGTVDGPRWTAARPPLDRRSTPAGPPLDRRSTPAGPPLDPRWTAGVVSRLVQRRCLLLRRVLVFGFRTPLVAPRLALRPLLVGPRLCRAPRPPMLRARAAPRLPPERLVRLRTFCGA